MPRAAKVFRPSYITEAGYKSRQDGRHALYSMWQWRGPRGIRAMRLSEEPLCRTCLAAGRYTAATDVDHIEPHRGNVEKFLNYENTQSLCKSCHSRKTLGEANRGIEW